MSVEGSVFFKNQIDYELLLEKHPWLIRKNQKAIISPDVDGILCGLFMSEYYDWEIVGYYDGKNLAVEQSTHASECIFLDVEIYRDNIRSCGHHMVLYNKKNIPSTWGNFSGCINPNIIRDFDVYNNFQEKYPLAMIHLLLCVIGSQKGRKISLARPGICPLLYVDGTFKNLLNYPENCTSWLKFLNAKKPESPLYPMFILFANQKLSTMMHDLENIFGKFREISGGKRGGDKIKISEICEGSFPNGWMERISKLLDMLSGLTGWRYRPEKWAWGGLKVLTFSKEIREDLNNGSYFGVIAKNPLSFAVTATRRIEYTLEQPNSLP